MGCLLMRTPPDLYFGMQMKGPSLSSTWQLNPIGQFKLSQEQVARWLLKLFGMRGFLGGGLFPPQPPLLLGGGVLGLRGPVVPQFLINHCVRSPSKLPPGPQMHGSQAADA